MLEVTVKLNGEVELARVIITNVGGDSDAGNYSVQVAVNRGKETVGLHQRGIDAFPRLKYNVLGLLLQALKTLDEKELELEDGISASDMARKVRGALPEVPSKAEGFLHNYRPPFWRK